MKTPKNKRLAPTRLLVLAALLIAAAAFAVPFHQPTIDGVINRDGVDWDPADLVVDASDGEDLSRTSNVRRLLFTWDADNLYLGVTYQDFGDDEALKVYLDIDRGIGPNDAINLQGVPGNFLMPEDHRFELIVARSSLDGGDVFGGPPPATYLVTDDDGTVSVVTDQVTAAQAANTGAKFPFWANAELAIPWSTIYPDQAGTVPPYAVIKAVAIAALSAPDGNGFQSAPANDGLDGGTTQVLLENLHASVVDADGDGEPDPADATISGTVTLPADPGTGGVTVTARLIDFSGRDPVAPLSVITTAEGVRTWTLPRLPAGRYEVTTEALGFIPATQTIDVLQSQQVTGVDQELAESMVVSGTIGFDVGRGAAGWVEITDTEDNLLDGREFDLPGTGGSYLLFVNEPGDFTVSITAENYLPQSQDVSVVYGENLDNIDFLLVSETEVSGTVGFAGGEPQVGTIFFLDDMGEDISSQDFLPQGGPFQFFTPGGGQFSLRAQALPKYVTQDTALTFQAQEHQTGISIDLIPAAFVTSRVLFEGPEAAGIIEVHDEVTGDLRTTIDFDTAGEVIGYWLQPGRVRWTVSAPGYVEQSVSLDVSYADTTLADFNLVAVRATRVDIIDADGNALEGQKATVMDPDDQNTWTSTRIEVAARDALGRDDLYDLDGRLVDLRLTALKAQDVTPPRGTPQFYNEEFSGSNPGAAVDSVVNFVDARAEFWISSTVIELLRVYLAQPNKDPLEGRTLVSIVPPQPEFILLTAEYDTLIADNIQTLAIKAKLFDQALKPSLIPELPLSFAVLNSGTGVGQFETATITTNAQGEAIGTLRATGSGVLHVTASGSYQNDPLDVRANDLLGDETYLSITSLPGETVGWRLNLPSNLAALTDPVAVGAQTIDRFGNPTPDPGQAIDFTASPAELGSFIPTSAVSDDDGRASTTFQPAGIAGLLEISGSGGTLAGDQSSLQLKNVTLVPDPVWYEEPEDRKTWDQTDLTGVIIDNTPDELNLEIPFKSTFGDLILHVAFETNNDAEGAAQDPFLQPVFYGHDHKPDYVLSWKYSANDYGDFRRWNGTDYDFWNPDTGEYGGSGDIHTLWIDKFADRVMISIPKEPFGGAFPASLRLEAYLTQELEDGTKRSAFDSAPLDATLNLEFDYINPGEDDWEYTETPVTLVNWGAPYLTKTDFPTPPTVENVIADPADLDAGDTFLLTAIVTDAGDGVGDVLADLSAMGGNPLARMYDDGDANHGDLTAGDGLFSLMSLVPLTNPGGSQELVVQAFDENNVWASKAGVSVDVTPQIDPIIVALDPVGDDHGPNQSGRTKMFYTYPTNIAFVDGAFDLTGLTIYETTANVGGEMIDMIAFQVSMVDFPDPADPGTADWSPFYADMNITKIDILIDSGPGGATATLPGRQAAYQPWDAWDYAIIMDGWYKAFIPSRSENTIDSWRQNALRNDQDILLLSDPVRDTVTALISKAALNDPTEEEILGWDICVAMCSHDFGGEEVLGGIRWVHEARSEWQFGGGHQENIDSNYMDLLLVPGAGHKPGLPQEDILDYESPQAIDRQKNLLTPVAIEMSQFEDTGPPVIDTGSGEGIVTKVAPIDETPLALSLDITDDYYVEKATFRYRSIGFEGQGWDREIPMGYLGRDRWVVDILPSWLDSNLIYSPIDSTRYLEFEVEASDPLDKTTISPVTTLQIFPNRLCRPRDGDLASPDLALLQVDGSGLLIPERTARIMTDQHMAEAWPGETVPPDSTQPTVELQWDVCNIEEAVKRAPVVPEGRPLGVFRQVFLATADTLGGYIDYFDKLPGDVQLSLHYPQEWVPAGLDENLISLYEYNPQSDRWILVGGNVTPTGNNVTATINRAATYGLFATDASNYNPGEVISGITLSPNPFSPNGDDLYDETNISFFLSQEATITVEIYNIEGNRKTVLVETFPFSGSDITDPQPRRVPGLIWDGRDSSGEYVPYGIYVVRVIATYTQAGVTRSVRSNHSLAVIR